MSTYPEHEKMAAIKDQSQAIGEFIEWLGSQRMAVGEWVHYDEFRDEQFVPARRSITDLLADHFEIDLNKIETEKRHMLASHADLTEVAERLKKD